MSRVPRQSSDPSSSAPDGPAAISAVRPETVRRMFAGIASRYDLNNRLHSLWCDQRWRRGAVRAAGLATGEAVLDVACGTGDLAALFQRAGAGRVVGLDFCEEMLDVARRRFAGRGVEWVCGDAMALPFEGETFDVVSIAFGIRNVAQPAVALAQFRRVLRPGGRLVVLEFDRPRGRVLGALARLYLDRVMPRTAAAIAGDRAGAYEYLQSSVKAFWSAGELAEAIASAGLVEVRTQRLTLGIAALHSGRRP